MFGKAEIGYLDMPVRSEQDVLRFEVSIDDIQRMKVIKRKGNFGGVKLCNRIRESLQCQFDSVPILT